MEIPDIKFEDKFLDGYGYMSISGLDTSRELLASIWSQFRKYLRNSEGYNTDATISFIGANSPKIEFYVICNSAHAKNKNLNREIYFKNFVDSFQRIMTEFQQLVLELSCDEDFSKCKTQKEMVYVLHKYRPDIRLASEAEHKMQEKIFKERRVAQQNT